MRQADVTYAAAEVDQIPSQWLVYADPGSGKSTFASTFPKPLLVLCFDPLSKAMPYRDPNRVGEVHRVVDNDVPIDLVYSKKDPGVCITQIEYYGDGPAAYNAMEHYFGAEKFIARVPYLFEEIKEGLWATVVLDSITQFEYAHRNFERIKNNPMTNRGNQQDRRQWYNSSGDEIEKVCNALAWATCNVVVLAHVRLNHDQETGAIYLSPEAPGVKGRQLPSLYAECYTMFVDAEGIHRLQTHKDGRFMCMSFLRVPTGTLPHYRELHQPKESE